ncbi:hypothetical protein LshimejAT787_1101330 [Lyophyllum shimeji]|uniref:Uncharacterized protein n=1 Tax=Lyophyllum shimeji TaxID=47721 RepID=A0A9P3PU80_LYOSH|nr:hypothetical protein LshimejAT787_1101330 [Lyophyllum shimeji]
MGMLILSTDLVRTFVAIVVHNTFALTIYTVIAVKAIRALLYIRLCRRRSAFDMFSLHSRIGRTKVSTTTLAIVIVMFLIAVILWTLHVVNFVVEATMTLVDDSDTPIDIKLANAKSSILGRLVVTDLLYAYMCLLGDSVIIWRVYAFWDKARNDGSSFSPGRCSAGPRSRRFC